MVKWLVIGIGDIARRRVLPAILQEPRSELYGLLTRDPRKREPYRARASSRRSTTPCATPRWTRFTWRLPWRCTRRRPSPACAPANTCFARSPSAMNYPQAESMVAAARESGRLLGVAYYRRLYPKVLRTRQLIAEGAIGKPVLAEANCHSWLPGRAAQLAVGPGAGGRRTALRYRLPPHRRVQLSVRPSGSGPPACSRMRYTA